MNRWRRKYRVAWAVVCAGTLAAGPVRAQNARTSPAAVDVVNSGDVPVVVFLVREPLHLRLGTVEPRANQTLALPADVPRGEVVRVFAHPEGGGYLPSRELRVEPGARLHLEVPAGAVGSSSPPALQPASEVGEGTTTVTVRNNTDGMLTLYVERGAFDARIGTVQANQERIFQLPETLVRGQKALELFVHPEHGSDLAGRRYAVREGGSLVLTVPGSGAPAA